MLSLSSDDLDSFIFHNLDKLHTYIVDSEEKNTLTESDKQELLSSLSDLELTLASKSKRPKAA